MKKRDNKKLHRVSKKLYSSLPCTVTFKLKTERKTLLRNHKLKLKKVTNSHK